MKKYKNKIYVVVGIIVAIFLIQSDFINNFITSLDGLRWLGMILAGIFFTSLFTTAPAIAVLGVFALNSPIWEVVLFGGIGAVIGDFIIFSFVRGRVYKELEFLLSEPSKNRIPLIFKKELFKFLLPFIGALFIASPLPDEMGVAMLGISNISKKNFFILVFLLHSFGIFVVVSLARAVAGF